MIKGVASGTVLVFCMNFLYAQTSPNLRTRKLIIDADTISLDTSVIIRGSFQLSSGSITYTEDSDYIVDYSTAKLIPVRIEKGAAVISTYRTLPMPVLRPYKHKNTDLIHPEYIEVKNPFLYSPHASREALFDPEGLKMNGNISRGVSVGNNQNVVLNSNLNLQLSGKLTDIDIVAAISDENNPIQPEGNTQQLQDFDKVFIRLSKNRTTLTIGDFEMVRPAGSYFMNYFKKSRGGQVATAIGVGKRGTIYTGGEAALSRGRFARNVINGIEGNQGPYRLSGANRELFIIIISGTEAVYLDGEKLKRGEQNDYVIDYNSGEVVFMPRRMITQYSRIVIEFQYSDRNYARSVFHANTAYETSKYNIRFNYFTEQDHRNQPFLQDLSDSNKLLLASVGDNLSEALAPSATPTTTFSRSRILYRKTDTLGYSGIYVFTDDPASDTVFYELKFSYVGEGRGNYIQAQSGANGRVFQWIAPQGGVPQGNYEPVIPLVSPKRMQMLTAGLDLKSIKRTILSVEYARSIYDKNLFSNNNKGDDGGNGLKIAAGHVIPLEHKQENAWHIQTDLSYEYVDQHFRYVERYRNVEFDRTWNRLLINTPSADTGYEENILSMRSSLNKNSIGNLFYQFGHYNRAGSFTGFQNQAGTALRYGRNTLNADAEWISTRNMAALPGAATNEVNRYRADYGRALLFFIAGVKYETEQSIYKRNNDSLQAGSYSYDQYTFYVKNADTSALNYKLEYSQREDFLPRNTEFAKSTTGKNAGASVEWMQKNMNRISANFTYREFEVIDTGFTPLRPERTILSRIEYDVGLIRRVLTANIYYQLGSGNELRRDYQFIEVPFGQGQYVWKDFDGDDKQTLNEFVIASFADKYQANYIKVFLPTNTTIRTNSNQFNTTFHMNPAAAWSNKQGLKKIISRFNNQTALKLDRKTTDLNTTDFFNPFVLNINDSLMISNTSVIRNTLFFNRSDPTFGADLAYQDSRSKSFLTNGFDTRRRQEQGLNIRWNFTTALGITAGYTYGYRSYYSDFFTTNNYYYGFREIKPKFIYQVTQNLRATLLFSYFEGKTTAEFGNKTGTNREIGAEGRYSIAKTGALNARYSMYTVSFDGDVSSPLGYDMLQGFVVGANMVWNINYQQRLGSNVQLTLSYDGRKSEALNAIHVGRVEARYIF